MKTVKVNDIVYVVRGTVSAEVANNIPGGTEELKKRYNNVDTVLMNGDTYYFCDSAVEVEFNDIKWYLLVWKALLIISKNIKIELKVI